MTTFDILLVGLALALKHFIADGPLQLSYQYLNKGNWRHFGGYIHAGTHGIFTLVIFAPYGLWWLGIGDFVVHYCIDWCKVNLTKKYGWSGMATDTTGRRCLQIYSDYYFWALVADQCLHFMTYVVFIYLAMRFA